MDIHTIHSFLVHPDKRKEEKNSIRGTKVTGEGQLVNMLRAIFDAAPAECKYEIAFLPATDGKQQNDCRDLLMAYISSPTKSHGLKIAERLQSVTTNRSGLGLFFLILGNEKKVSRLVASRFPADNGILAEEQEGTLNVEFIERIFMKSATAYKSAVYEGSSPEAHFWTGRAIDKQINSDITISDYWIKEFLLSDFAVTGARGTRRLAVALRDAMNQSDNVAVKQELASAARLAPNLDGQVTSAVAFLDHLDRTTIRVERVRESDERHAIALVRAHEDKTYSLCDAQSFVVMERLRIREAIAADDDFRQYGFRTLL